MTKAALCVQCSDIVAPHRDWVNDRSWRWCEGHHTGVRWRDGGLGRLEVTAVGGPDMVRVIGLNNLFVELAVSGRRGGTGSMSASEWRDLHVETAKAVDGYYLFHHDQRDCWALVVRVGESGDVTFVDYDQAMAGTP